MSATVLVTCGLDVVTVWRVPQHHPNVVLISVDTLRADHLGAYGYAHGTSPFIDSLAARGAVFDQAVTPMPATGPSHAALLTGQHPLVTGLLINAMPLRDGIETVAEAFQRSGYATIGTTGVYHLSSRYGFARGFDRFAEVKTDREIRRSADAVTADLIRMLGDATSNNVAQPVFIFAHYFDAHAPYGGEPDPVLYHGGAASPDTIAKLTGAYDAGIRGIDAQIRHVWDAIERSGLAWNTIIAITADHGEQLGEHGFVGGHADFYRETLRVPLIIAGPGVRPVRINSTVSLMDVAPTLLALAGLAFGKTTQGVSLLPSLAGVPQPRAESRGVLVLGYPTYTRSIAWLTDRYYYVRNLEDVYRTVALDPLPTSRPGVDLVTRDADVLEQDGRRAFIIPGIDVEPYSIVADLMLTPTCQDELFLAVAPGIDMAGPIMITGPTRLAFSLARLDTASLRFASGTCVTGVRWGFRPETSTAPSSSSPGGHPPVTTSLFNGLLTARKDSPADELYDLATDPKMTRNVIHETAAATVDILKRDLQHAFVRLSPLRGQLTTMRREEEERLRALGYIR